MAALSAAGQLAMKAAASQARRPGAWGVAVGFGLAAVLGFGLAKLLDHRFGTPTVATMEE